MSWLKSKMKEMASRAQDAIAQAAEVVAPAMYASSLEELSDRWDTVLRLQQSVLEERLDPLEERRAVKSSRIRANLDTIVHLLKQEERDADLAQVREIRFSQDHSPGTEGRTKSGNSHDTSSRPCLEYLLEVQLLQQLCAAGEADRPSGMRLLALQFVRALFSHVQHGIILPTHGIYPAILQLLRASIRIENKVISRHVVSVMGVLWKKLQEDSCLIECFFAVESQTMESHGPSSHLLLFTGLLPFMFSPSIAGERAREALVVAVALCVKEPRLEEFVVTRTSFCEDVIQALILAFEGLPMTKEEEEKRLKKRKAMEEEDHVVQEGEQSSILDISDPELEKDIDIDTFCSYLNFCSMLMVASLSSTPSESESRVAKRLLHEFRAEFLDKSFHARFFHTSEAVAFKATANMLRMLESFSKEACVNPVFSTFKEFLFVEPVKGVEMDYPEPHQLPAKVVVREEVISRINSLSEELRIVTLELFISLLEFNEESFLYEVILDLPLATANYCEPIIKRAPLRTSDMLGWFVTRFPGSEASKFTEEGFRQISTRGHSDMQTREKNPGDTSVISYIADAEYSVTMRRIACGGWNSVYFEQYNETSQLDEVEAGEARSSPAERIVDISLFFKTLWKRFEMYYSLSGGEILRLTELVAILAQIPNDHLFRILYDVHPQDEQFHRGEAISDENNAPRPRPFVSLRQLLESAWKEGLTRLRRIENGKELICKLKQQENALESSSSISDPKEKHFITCFILLEEFLKEISCVLHAKERLESIPLQPEGHYMQPTFARDEELEAADDLWIERKTQLASNRQGNNASLNEEEINRMQREDFNIIPFLSMNEGQSGNT